MLSPIASILRIYARAVKRLRAARVIAPALFSLLLLGCGAGSDAPGRGFEIEELPTPARAGSGEPHLAVGYGSVVLSWLEAGEGGAYTLYTDRLEEAGWRGRRAVVTSDRFFVNWADFPSVVPLDRSTLVAHWLLRGDQGGYDYGIRTAVSDDGGRSWSEAWIPHTDDTPTEHGFVSTMPLGEGRFGLVWLDGRDFALHGEGRYADHEHPEGPEMSLRFRTSGTDGRPGPEQLLDRRVCDCCQTDMVRTSRGLLVVYRDRSPEEVRDVYATRRTADGWTEPAPVHEDGWVFPACPVNGPAAAGGGDRVAVAWFTGARDTARVQVAFSRDAGATFGAPTRVDDGNPAGRVDVVLTDEGEAIVSWLERTEEGAEIRMRRVGPDGEAGSATTVARSTEGRSSGFPRMVRISDGTLVLAWTDVRGSEPRVRVARARPGPTSGEGTQMAGAVGSGENRP